MKKSFYDWCIENNRQDLLDRWDYKLNAKSPNEVSYADKENYYFYCGNINEHPSTRARLWHLVRGLASLKCDTCNSFAQWCRENISYDYIDKYWCYDLNKDVDPWKISKKSDQQIYLKCDNGCDHVYPVSPRGFLVGAHSCRVCNGKIVIKGFNDLFTSKPDLKLIWNYDKNIGISPYEVTYGSSKKVWWKCDKCGYEWEANISNVSKGHRCPECGRLSVSNAKRRTHEDFVRKIELVNPNIDVIGEYITSAIKVRCKCKIDKYEWNAWPDHLIRGIGCPICAKKMVAYGINDITTTNPNLVKYFKNKEDAKLVSSGSNKKVDVICPDCGYEKSMWVRHLVNNGFSCPRCSDGVSYPNKFCREVISQLPVLNVQYEWSPDWVGRKFYDNYFEYSGKPYIVEADGKQHYGDVEHFHKSSIEIQKNDREKEELAKSHGITVIRIDCKQSNLEYISHSILNSELNKIFDLSKVDWKLCDKNARSSLVKKICDYYNEVEEKNILDISKIFKLSDSTIKKYLKQGNALGFCNYEPKRIGCQVCAVSLNDNKKYIFKSFSECIREMFCLYGLKLSRKRLKDLCDNIVVQYPGFKFSYVDVNTIIDKEAV